MTSFIVVNHLIIYKIKHWLTHFDLDINNFSNNYLHTVIYLPFFVNLKNRFSRWLQSPVRLVSFRFVENRFCLNTKRYYKQIGRLFTSTTYNKITITIDFPPTSFLLLYLLARIFPNQYYVGVVTWFINTRKVSFSFP